jgi:flotillin
MLTSIISIIVGLFLVSATVWVLKLRRIVPTNVVHIVQRGKNTVSYGVGQAAGNSYYEFPIWVPILGVEVRKLPVSNFDISLDAYPAYDVDRVPFLVDIKAFFHIENTNKAAAKVENIEELKEQLRDIVRGVVRSILAKSSLQEIMGERPKYAKAFTEAVEEDLKSWGVESVKSIELMDVRDDKSDNSNVIHNIMAKKKSAIEKESRMEVAKNHQEAEQAELEARKAVAVKAAATEQEAGEARAKSFQAIGIANANAKKASGIADQSAVQEIAAAEQLSAEEQMKVLRVQQVRQAEIDKERQIIGANLAKEQVQISAEANLYDVKVRAEANAFDVEKAAEALLKSRKDQAEGTKATGTAEADVILAKGKSVAESRKLDELARVIAETTLAEKIGKNPEYQDYLVKLEVVKKDQVVGVAEKEAMAKALASADLKLLVNSGDVSSGLHSFADILSSKGGSQLNGLVEALKQTPQGEALLGVVKDITSKKPKK